MPPQRLLIAADAKRLLHVAVGVLGRIRNRPPQNLVNNGSRMERRVLRNAGAAEDVFHQRNKCCINDAPCELLHEPIRWRSLTRIHLQSRTPRRPGEGLSSHSTRSRGTAGPPSTQTPDSAD